VGIAIRDGRLALAASGREPGRPEVVVPRVGFGVTEHALAVVRQMEGLGIPVTAGSGAIAACRDKMTGLQVLARAGLPVPDTALVRQPGDADWAIDSVGGPPVVLKFLSGTHGVGVFLAESAEAARTVLEAMWGVEKNLLVQRYVRAAAGRDLRLFVVAGRVVAGMRRIGPEGSLRANLHHGGRAEAYEPSAEIASLATRAADAVGLPIAGVDVLEDENGPLLTEVNSSPGLEGIEEASGVDVAGGIADAALALAGGGPGA
jgi:ribosomal protein S6--L-glutamate ligase